MRKKYLVLATLFLISIPVISAIDFKDIYNGEVTGTKTIEADGEEFLATLIGINDYYRVKIVFPNGKSTILVYPDKCEVGIDAEGDDLKCECEEVCQCALEDIYQVCLYSVRRGTDSEFNMTTQSYPYYAKISIEKSEAIVTLKRTFEKTTLTTGESTKVEVEITNTGSEHIVNAEYKDPYPEEIKVKDVSGCEKESNSAVWKGPVSIGETVKFSYYIEGLKKVDLSSIANFTFNEDSVSDSQNIKIESPKLVINSTYPESVDLGKEFSVDMIIANKDTELSTDLKYKIYIPPEFEVISKGDLDKFTNYYGFSDIIEKSEEKNISMILKPKKTGGFTIKEEYDYSYGDLDYSGLENNEVIVSLRDINLAMTIDDVKMDEQTEIPIRIANPNRDNKFANINMEIETDLPISNKKSFLSSLNSNEIKEITKISFIPLKEEYYIKIKLSYETMYSETIKKEFTEKIKVGESTEKVDIQTPVENDNQEESPAPIEENIDSSENDSLGNIKLIIIAVAGIIILSSIIGVFMFGRKPKTLEQKVRSLEKPE